MKRYFLIDTENIGNRPIPGMENLSNKDTVILFHNEGSNIFKMVEALTESPSAKEVVKMDSHHKNAMDFQICTKLAFLVAQVSDGEFFIISKDKGYQSAIEFIKSNVSAKITVEVLSAIPEAGAKGTLTTLDDTLAAYPRKVRKVAREGFSRCTTPLDYHNFLQKNLPRDGQMIYKLIKPDFYSLRALFV